MIPSRGLLHGFKIRNRFFGWDSLTLLRSVLILIKVSFHPFKDRYTFFFLLLDNRQTDRHTHTHTHPHKARMRDGRGRGTGKEVKESMMRIFISGFFCKYPTSSRPVFFLMCEDHFVLRDWKEGEEQEEVGGGVEEGKRCLALPWVRAQGSLYEGSLHHLKKEEEK